MKLRTKLSAVIPHYQMTSTTAELHRPLTLKLDGNGHRVVGYDGDTFFLLGGEIEVTFFNVTFDNFHATQLGQEVGTCSIPTS